MTNTCCNIIPNALVPLIWKGSLVHLEKEREVGKSERGQTYGARTRTGKDGGQVEAAPMIGFPLVVVI